MDDVRQKNDAKEILKERETREGKEPETDGEGDEEHGVMCAVPCCL